MFDVYYDGGIQEESAGSLTVLEKMKISHIDHLVLTVTNIDETVRFYEAVLGMVKESFGDGRVALTFGSQKINLHQKGNELEPKAEK